MLLVLSSPIFISWVIVMISYIIATLLLSAEIKALPFGINLVISGSIASIAAYASPGMSSELPHAYLTYAFSIFSLGFLIFMLDMVSHMISYERQHTIPYHRRHYPEFNWKRSAVGPLVLSLLGFIFTATSDCTAGRTHELGAHLGTNGVAASETSDPSGVLTIPIAAVTAEVYRESLEMGFTDDLIRTELLGEEFDSDVEEVQLYRAVQMADTEHIRLISEANARFYMERVLGDRGTLQELDDLTIQAIDGEIYWVAPLQPNGYWRYNRQLVDGRNATDGYVIFSAEDPSDEPELVLVERGLQCTMGAYWENNLIRRIRMESDNRRYQLRETSFELRDGDHRPFYAVTATETAIGSIAYAVRGVYLVDAVTCEVEFHPVGEIPEWIDRVYPQSTVRNHIRQWGMYAQNPRWMNWAEEGRRKMTGSTNAEGNLVEHASNPWLNFGADGQAYWWTGITNARTGNLTGFMQVNARTGDTTFYHRDGGHDEDDAMAKCNTVFSNLIPGDRRVQWPTFYLIDGLPTYVMQVTESNGNSLGYCMTYMYDTQITGLGTSPQSTYASYREAGLDYFDITLDTIEVMTEEATAAWSGYIDRINLVGEGSFHFTVKRGPEEFGNGPFQTTLRLSPVSGVLRDGDYVTFGYNPGDTITPVVVQQLAPASN
jgi:hypothetical protein